MRQRGILSKPKHINVVWIKLPWLIIYWLSMSCHERVLPFMLLRAFFYTHSGNQNISIICSFHHLNSYTVWISQWHIMLHYIHSLALTHNKLLELFIVLLTVIIMQCSKANMSYTHFLILMDLHEDRWFFLGFICTMVER